MFTSDGSVLRGDLLTYVEQAAAVDQLFIASKMLPMEGVDLKDGRYPFFTIANTELLSNVSTKRAPTGTYGRVQRDFTMQTYSTIDRGLEELVDDARKEEVSRFFDAEVKAAKFTLRAMMMDYEVRVAAVITTSGNYLGTAVTAATVSYTAAHIADGTLDPVTDVLTAIDRLTSLGVVPNTIQMSTNIYTRMRQCIKLQNYIRGNRPSDSQILLKPADIAAAFGLDQCLVGRAPRNTARKGQTSVLATVWPDTYIFVGYLAGGDPQAGGFGRTFVWNAEGGLWVTESYRAEDRRSNVIRVRQHTAEQVIDQNCGQLITTNYA